MLRRWIRGHTPHPTAHQKNKERSLVASPPEPPDKPPGGKPRSSDGNTKSEMKAAFLLSTLIFIWMSTYLMCESEIEIELIRFNGALQTDHFSLTSHSLFLDKFFLEMSTKGPMGDLVVCCVHHARRLLTNCDEVPVLDANKNEVGRAYRCKPSHQCTNRGHAEALSFDGSSSSMKGRSGAVEGGGGIMGISFTPLEGDSKPPETDGSTQAPTKFAGSGGSRYYELLERGQQGGGGGPHKKVCWNCGLSGHEKPECTNSLCRTCHGRKSGMGQPHHCGEVLQSSFIFTLTCLPNNMAQVQCVRCGSNGHLDCAYTCTLRENTRAMNNQSADRWVQRMSRGISAGGQRMVHYNQRAPSNFHAGGNGGYNGSYGASYQGHQRQGSGHSGTNRYYNSSGSPNSYSGSYQHNGYTPYSSQNSNHQQNSYNRPSEMDPTTTGRGGGRTATGDAAHTPTGTTDPRAGSVVMTTSNPFETINRTRKEEGDKRQIKKIWEWIIVLDIAPVCCTRHVVCTMERGFYVMIC
eukprot:gene4830-3469_t